MANEWSQDLLDELNSAGQEFESAALSGDSSIPDNVRETVAENVLYRYYQEQKKAEATKNGIGTSAKLLNNMKQGNPWRPTGADFAYAQTGYDENGKPLSAQDWSTKLQTDKEEADKKVSELQQKLSTLEANRDANSYLQGMPSLYALVQDKLPNGSLEEIDATKKALEEAQAQQGKIQKAMEYANAAKTNSEYQDQLEKLRKEEGKNYLEIYAESGQKIDNLNEMLKDYNQRLEDTKKTYGRLWDATEEGKTYSKMVDDINAQLEKEMGFRSFTESYLNPADDKNADAIIQQGKELAQLMEANQQAAGRAVLQERDPDAGISTYTQYRAATREGTHVRDDWPEEQKNNYYYLFGKFGEKAAEDYAVRVNTELNQTALQAGTKKAQEFGAQEKGNLAQKIGAGVAGLALSAGTPIFHAMSYIDKMSAVASGVPYTGRNFALPSDQVNAMVQGRASQINKDHGTLPSTIPVVGGKGWGDLYQLGQSVVQSLVLGNTIGEVGTLAAFFAQAGDTAFDEAKARGGSDEYAAAVSVLAGAAEAAGEKIGLDHLFHGGADLAKGLGTYLVNQSLIEGAEEGVTDILNLFGDQLASRMTGNETKMQQDVRALTDRGMDKKEAEREVWKRFVNDTAFDMVGGFVSGAVSAGVQGPASIKNQVGNKLWDMRKDSVLGKQNAEGKREGGKADVSEDELEKMIDRALKRGDLAGAEELMRRLDEKTGNAEEQEYGPADPRANEKMRGRLERQLNGERVNPQAEETEPQGKPEVKTPPALPEEFKDLNPVVAEQFATYEGRDLERITRSMPSQEAYRYEEYLRSIGQNEKADLVDRYRTDPTFHYEEKAPAHTDEEDPMRYAPQNATGASATPRGQITKPRQQNAAQTVKPQDSSASQSNGKTSTAMINDMISRMPEHRNFDYSTLSRESGTMTVPNTQEVNNNAGEQTLRQPESSEAGRLRQGDQRSDGRNRDESGYSLWRDGSESSETDQGRKSPVEERLPRFVTREDRATLSSAEESAPITEEQKKELTTLNSVLNDGAQVVSKPKIGSRLHLAFQLAKKLNMRTLFLKNANYLSVFRRGIFGAARRGFATIDGNGTIKEPVNLVTHESGHYKLHDRFGDIGEIANGAYKKRLSLFSEVFNNAFGVMRGLQAMSAVEKYMRQTKKYEAVYAATRNKAISQVSKILAKSGTYLSQDATSLVAEMEKASAIEEFLNQVLAWDETFLNEAERHTGISPETFYSLRDILTKALVNNQIYTQDEIDAINDAIAALEEDDFTDDFGEETANAENSNAGDEGFDTVTNYYYDSRGSWRRVESDLRSGTGDKSTEFNLNKAVRAVQNGDVESLSNYELQKVYDYITNGLPNTSNNRLTRISNQMLDAKAANRLAANDSKTQARLDAAYLVLNEMEARGMDTKRVPARWKFVSEAHSDSEITPETSADEIVAAIRDGDTELEKDIMYGRGDWANYTVKERLDILENNPDQTYYDAGDDRIAKESSFGYDDEAADEWKNEDRPDNQYDSGETDTKREERWDARKGREYRDQLLKAADYERRKVRGEATSWADAERGANYVKGAIPATENGWVGAAKISDEEYEEAKQILKESEQYDRAVSRLKSLREQMTELQSLANQYAGSTVERGKEARATIRNYELAIQDYTDLMNEALEAGDANSATFYLTAANELQGMLASTREYLDYLKGKYKSSEFVGDFGIFTEKINRAKVDVLAAEWAIERMTQSAKSLFADAASTAKVAEETGSDTAKRHADELAKQARKRKNRESWATRTVYQHDEYGKGQYNVGGEREITRGYGGVEIRENISMNQEDSEWQRVQKAKEAERAARKEIEPKVSSSAESEETRAERVKNRYEDLPNLLYGSLGEAKYGNTDFTTSEDVRNRNLEAYQESMRAGVELKANEPTPEAMDRLNRMFAERLGIENKGSTAIAYSNRQKDYGGWSFDVDADAADFGEPTRGMGTGYRGMQTSRSKDGGLEFHTMYDDALPTRPATDKSRKPLAAPSTAYSSVLQAARSILNSKSSFLDFSKSRPKDIPFNVTKEMGQLREHVREMMEGEHPVNALMQISNMIQEFANDDDLKMFSSESIQNAAKDLNDIYYNQDITNDEKAKRMVENATRTLTLLSKRIQLVDRGYHMLRTFTGPRKKRDGTNIWSRYKAMQLNPATLFKAMDGFDRRGAGSGYKIAKMIENGTALYTITQTQALQKFSELAGLEGYKEFTEGNAKPFDIDGVQITEQQAVEFIMQVRNLMNTAVTDKNGPTNRLNTIDGFSIKDKNGKNVFVEMSHEDEGPNAEWFQNLAEGIENSLSPAAKKYLEAATEVLDELGRQSSDIRTNLIGTGFEGSLDGTYYPITYDNKNGTRQSQQNRPTSLADGPMFQSRTRNVGGYVSIKNVSDTMDKYIHWASNFIGYGEVAELLYAMDNTGSRMQNLTSLADDMLGSGYSKYISDFVKDVNENQNGEKDEKSVLSTLRKNMAAGALLGNLGVAAKQAASYFSAVGVLSPQAVLSVWEWNKYSGAGNMLLQSRKTGTSLDPSISEILHNDSFIGKLMKRTRVSEFMGKATALVDYQTVKRLFAATVVDTKLSFPGMDQNSELFAQAVEAKFQDVVLQTQPIFVKNARAGYLRSNNELMKALAMFRTQPTQNLNAIVTAIGEYNALKGTDLGKAAGKRLRNTIIGQTASAVTFAMLSSIVSFARHGLKKFRDDDDEQSWIEVAKRIGLDTLESLAGITLFGGDIAKLIITAATGGEEKEFYDLNAGVLSMFSDTVSSVATFTTNTVKAMRDHQPLAVFNAGRQAADNLLQLGAGIPANTVYRLLNSITMYTADAMYKLSDGKLGNRANYDDAMKMLDAYIKGTLTEEGAKTQAAKAFRNDQPENLLYNLGILSSLTKEGQGDKGSDWLNDRIQGKTDAQRKAYKEDELARLGRNLNPGERIANYIADSTLSAADKDKAISQYATTSGYNILYESLRAAGMTPETAVKELGKTDNKTGLSTTIMADGSLETLYAGTDKPGTTNDVPALDRKNTEEYVNFVSAMKVFKETGNYDQLDKLVDQYSKLDENTRAVIDAKDSTVKKYQEYRDLGLSTKDYHAVKDAIKEAQSDLDLDANTGSAVKLVGLSKTNLSDSQVQKLVGSESLGISKTGKALMDVLGKHGLNTEEIGMFLYNADFTNGESNGTLTNVEVAAQLAKTPGLTDKQRSQIYEELKPQLSSYYNDWGKYSYQNEISYIARKGLQLGRAS